MILPGNPAANVDRLPDRYDWRLRLLLREQVMALVRASATRQDGIRYLTAAFTGLRRGELVALRWRDVDFPGEATWVMHSFWGLGFREDDAGRRRRSLGDAGPA